MRLKPQPLSYVLRATRSLPALIVTVPIPLLLAACSCTVPAVAFTTTMWTRTTPVSVEPEQKVFVGAVVENLTATLEELKVKKEWINRILTLAGSLRTDGLNRKAKCPAESKAG